MWQFDVNRASNIATWYILHKNSYTIILILWQWCVPLQWSPFVLLSWCTLSWDTTPEPSASAGQENTWLKCTHTSTHVYTHMHAHTHMYTYTHIGGGIWGLPLQNSDGCRISWRGVPLQYRMRSACNFRNHTHFWLKLCPFSLVVTINCLLYLPINLFSISKVSHRFLSSSTRNGDSI